MHLHASLQRFPLARGTLLVVLILQVMLLPSCSQQQALEPWVMSFGRGMGGLDGRPDQQTYNYKFSLLHEDGEPRRDVKVLLVIGDNFKERVLTQDGPMEVSSSMLPGQQSLEIKGTMTIDTKDLTKQQISALGPVISAASIQWTYQSRVYTKRYEFK